MASKRRRLHESGPTQDLEITFLLYRLSGGCPDRRCAKRAKGRVDVDRVNRYKRREVPAKTTPTRRRVTLVRQGRLRDLSGRCAWYVPADLVPRLGRGGGPIPAGAGKQPSPDRPSDDSKILWKRLAVRPNGIEGGVVRSDTLGAGRGAGIQHLARANIERASQNLQEVAV